MFGGGSMAERWVVVRGRTSIELASRSDRAAWLKGGLKYAYWYVKTLGRSGCRCVVCPGAEGVWAFMRGNPGEIHGIS